MLGIFFYGGLAYGLGLLVPISRTDDHPVIGMRFVAGTALLLIALYLFNVLLAFSLRSSGVCIAALAALGWVAGSRGVTRARSLEAVTHPAFLLPLLGLVAVLANGGIDYVPYLVDEFTNWIGISRIIHWAGSYDAVRQTIYLSGYTPGWRLLLAAPWHITGEIELGLSAAAPLILHVAVLALLYDILARVLRESGGLSLKLARFGAWLVLLVILAVEATGRLWTYEMLIEQPQIYALSAAGLLLLRAELVAGSRVGTYCLAGLALAAGFLLKNAVAAAAPGAAMVALLPLLDTRRVLGERIRESLVCGASLLVPLVAVMASWSALTPPDTCLASPLQVFFAGIPEKYDPLDLARRLGLAVGDYVAVYKLPVTVAAAAGFAVGLRAGLFRGALLWVGFSGAYFWALYWYHLTCFGDYYYYGLNSIPRFTRVPLQMFHILGLALLVVGTVRVLGGRLSRAVLAVPDQRILVAGCLAALAALGAWQMRQTYRSVADLSTRATQAMDPRIAEMRNAAAFVRRHAGRDLPARPRLAILGQGQDGDVRAYAIYFARQATAPLFDVIPHSSWAPSPVNLWQSAASTDEATDQLAGADLLWPIRVDEWLSSNVLARLVTDPTCLNRLPAVVLVRDTAGEARFRCLAKED